MKPPTNEENIRLIRLAQSGDDDARREVVARNLGVCYKLAYKYAPFDQRDDWAHYGVIGLMQAVDGFDPSQNTRFATYAFACVRNYMLKQANYEAETVRLPKWIPRCRAIIARNPLLTDAELIEMYPYYGESMFRTARELKLSYVPLDETMTELVTLPDATPPYETKQLVDWLMSYLTDTEAGIIRSRFGLCGDEMTLTECGGIMGVTKTRIAQIQNAAIAAMRERVSELTGEGSKPHVHAYTVSSRDAGHDPERMGGALADRDPVAACDSRAGGYAQDAAR